jgi:3'(2'), 5'-bisphosphate nucleotidase
MLSTTSPDLRELLDAALSIALDAGAIALTHHDRTADVKSDGSPVTEADRACDAFIRTALAAAAPFPALTEETFESQTGPFPDVFWLVDPLDGTKEFIKRSGEFTVNIALISGSRPVVGVVYAPASSLAYFAAEGSGAFRRRDGRDEQVSVARPHGPLRVAVSRDHIGAAEQELISQLADAEVRPMGSSLKFCLVAEGAADLYPRFGRTREWDTAAAQCVLECAGGSVVDAATRQPLAYGKPDLVNPNFIAYGDAAALERVPRR